MAGWLDSRVTSVNDEIKEVYLDNKTLFLEFKLRVNPVILYIYIRIDSSLYIIYIFFNRKCNEIDAMNFKFFLCMCASLVNLLVIATKHCMSN